MPNDIESNKITVYIPTRYYDLGIGESIATALHALNYQTVTTPNQETLLLPNIYVTEKTLQNSIEHITGNKTSKIVQLAIEISKQTHSQQFRKNGQPFIEGHIFPVTNYLTTYKNSAIAEDQIIVAILHDVLEDSHNTNIFNELKQNFGENILTQIQNLTKAKSHNKVLQETIYVNKIMNSSADTRLIKCIDRLHNLMDDVASQFTNPTQDQKFKEVYLNETKNYYLKLYNSVKTSEPKISELCEILILLLSISTL